MGFLIIRLSHARIGIGEPNSQDGQSPATAPDLKLPPPDCPGDVTLLANFSSSRTGR